MSSEWDRKKPMLIAMGVLSPAGNTAHAQVRACPTCSARVLIGATWPSMFGDYKADIEPTTPAGEIAALIQGRRTFDIRPDPRNPGRWQLWTRAEYYKPNPFETNRIGGPDQRYDVVVEHRHGTRLPRAPSVVKPDLITQLPEHAPF